MISLFPGRFQPFHLGHFYALCDILRESKKVIILIGSAQFNNTFINPFSFSERKEMINRVILSENINRIELGFVYDFFNSKIWVEQITKNYNFNVVFSNNNWVRECFYKKSIEVRYLKQYKGFSGKEIRERIRRGKKWKHLVHRDVYKYIKEIKGEERIKKLV